MWTAIPAHRENAINFLSMILRRIQKNEEEKEAQKVKLQEAINIVKATAKPAERAAQILALKQGAAATKARTAQRGEKLRTIKLETISEKLTKVRGSIKFLEATGFKRTVGNYGIFFLGEQDIPMLELANKVLQSRIDAQRRTDEEKLKDLMTAIDKAMDRECRECTKEEATLALKASGYRGVPEAMDKLMYRRESLLKQLVARMKKDDKFKDYSENNLSVIARAALVDTNYESVDLAAIKRHDIVG